MRIYQPKNEYGQDLLSTADVVESIKTVTKAISGGAVEITKNDLGTDKASDWTVLEVVYGGNKIMADVASTDDTITVTLDDAGSTFSGDVVVTLTYEATMNISQEAQQPPVVQGAMIDENGALKGVALNHTLIKSVGDDVDFSNVTDGQYMFYECRSLTSFAGDMPALTNGFNMFYECTNLTSFSGDTSKMTDGRSMFENCTKLTSFSGDVSALTTGNNMFNRCSNLTSFTGDLSALTNGGSMFQNCSKLTSFSGDLSALTNGYQMFYGCSNLTSFSDKLSSLTNGTNMFSGCKLDQTSVDNILDTINDLKAQGKTGKLTLGVASGVNKRTSEFAAKGWTVN